MDFFKKIFLGALFIFMVAAPVTAVVTPQVASAAGNCEASLVPGVIPWYRGLTNADCSMKSPDDPSIGGIGNYIWRIVLNGIQMATAIAGYIAFLFILYGGFLFMTGGDNAGQVESARKTIFNAVIGLVIALSATAIINLIFSMISSNVNAEGVPQMSGMELLANGLNLTYFLAGTVAVIVIIVAGMMYITAAGDSGKIAKAKNMLLFAIIGLVLVLAAAAITGFVTARFN